MSSPIRKLFGRFLPARYDAGAPAAPGGLPQNDDDLIAERLRHLERCRDVIQKYVNAIDRDIDRTKVVSLIESSSPFRSREIMVISTQALVDGSRHDLVLHINPPREHEDLPRMMYFGDGSIELSMRSDY